MGKPSNSGIKADGIDQETSVRDIFDTTVKITRARVYKNLIVIGIMLLLSYSVTGPTVTLVTSLAGRTLGNVTFCLNYIFTCLFNFMSMSVVNKGTSKKRVMVIGNICLVGFAVLNWHISYYTLIPGTVFFGFGVSVVWIASMMYTSKLAVDYARRYNLIDKSVASFFTGVVVGLSNMGYLLGSASSAGVLTLLKLDEEHYNGTDSFDHNFTSFDEECHTNNDKFEPNTVTINALRGMIVFYSIFALAVLLFLDDIDEESRAVGTCGRHLLSNFAKSQWRDLVTMAKLVIKKESILPCFLCFAVGAGMSFIFTRFTKTYVAECMGVHVVGYAIMVYGIGGTLGSFISGKLLALKTEILIILGTLFVHLILMLFLLIWDREPIMFLLLFISLAWGTCDGSWITIFSSYAATYFEGEMKRYSFSLQWIVFQFGISFGALLSLTTPVKANLIVVCGMFLISVPLHLIVIYCTKLHVHKVYEIPMFFIDE